MVPNPRTQKRTKWTNGHGRKQIIKTEIKKSENKNTREKKINETKSCLFEKTNNIDEPVASAAKEKRKDANS